MHAAPIIRQFLDADRPACRALWAELTGRHRDLYGDPSIGGTDPGSHFDEYLNTGGLRGTWIAEVDGTVVGLTGLIVRGEDAEIEPLIVATPHRGKGIGTRLLEHAVEEAKQAGVRFLSVRPVARNAAAIEFFAAAGFGTVGQVELFQDLARRSDRKWKPGVRIQGREFRC